MTIVALSDLLRRYLRDLQSLLATNLDASINFMVTAEKGEKIGSVVTHLSCQTRVCVCVCVCACVRACVSGWLLSELLPLALVLLAVIIKR